ncbi:MAG: cryptochrome/photolyase family protein, partial [Pseudomonadota bacterium]
MDKAMIKSHAFLVLGDQLFGNPKDRIPPGSEVCLFEDYELCTRYKYHKHKIILFFSSMRQYASSLKKLGYTVHYFNCRHSHFHRPFEEKLDFFFSENPHLNHFHHYEINDHFFADRITQFCRSKDLVQKKHQNPMFLTSKGQFKNYLGEVKKPFMATFYSRQRKRLKVLVDENLKPEGGRWSFDGDNRKKYPKDIQLPEAPFCQPNSCTQKVIRDVEEIFPEHPGDGKNFWLPTNRKEAVDWVKSFSEHKISEFGPYQDAIHHQNTFGFHSVVSPIINNGLVTPFEVVQNLLVTARKKNLPLQSIEGYIRQVIGWREFVKGVYDNFSDRMNTENYWNHNRSMTKDWYESSTGILPFDDSVRKLTEFGYVHHIDRLMIQSSLMLLCEIHPKHVFRWFMEMYVDSADWVMEANVFGMGQMSEGGIFATKPYICGSNYILKMSDYKKGPWCDTLDGLYWRFIAKNRDFFAA